LKKILRKIEKSWEIGKKLGNNLGKSGKKWEKLGKQKNLGGPGVSQIFPNTY